MICGLVACHELRRALARTPPAVNGTRRLSGLGIVAGDKLGLELDDVRERAFNDRRNAAVDLAATAGQEALIGGIANERVAKDNLVASRCSSFEHQLGCQEIIQPHGHVARRFPDDAGKQPEGHFAPYEEATWASCFAASGRRSSRAIREACSVSGMLPAPAPEPKPDSTTDRVISSTNRGIPSVRAMILYDSGGNLAGCDVANDLCDLASPQPVELQQGNMGLVAERRQPLGTMRDHHQDSGAGSSRHD